MIYGFENCELDLGAHELRRAGEAQAIEPRVFKLLGYLVENSHRMVSKDEILGHVWEGRVVSDSALSSQIKAARKAIGDDGKAQRLLRTIHGEGFRFIGGVRKLARPRNGREDSGTFNQETEKLRQDVRFCTAKDGVRIAYAVVGSGKPLVKAANWMSHLDFELESPVWRHWIAGLSARRSTGPLRRKRQRHV